MGIVLLIIMAAAIAALVVFFFLRKAREDNKDEKPSQQPEAPKVEQPYEPKFKAGYWITDGRDVHRVVRVDKVLDKYFFEEDDFLASAVFELADKLFWRWSIKDAKDGDVLFTPSLLGSESAGITFIFKALGMRDYTPVPVVEFYCATSCDGFRIQEHTQFMGMADGAYQPATDDQASALFAAMAAAGYTWDSSKKELSRIAPVEQEKPSDENPSDDTLSSQPDFGRFLGILRNSFRLTDSPVTEGYTYELYSEAYSQYFYGRSSHGLPALLTEENFPLIKENVYGDAGDEDSAFLTLTGWLFAMQMAELLPAERTALEKKGYELGGITRDSNLYGWKFRCDPFNMRMVAASIYAAMKGLLSPDADAMRREVGGSRVPYTVLALRDTDTFAVSGDESAYVDLREFMGTAPGPYAPGYKDRSRIGGLPYPGEERDEYGNLTVDRETYEHVTENYNLTDSFDVTEEMAGDLGLLSGEQSRILDLHDETVQAIADKDADYHHLYGGRHTVNGDTFDAVFNKDVLGREVNPSLARELCLLTDDVLHIGSYQRCILQGHERQMDPPQYGRLRPGCSWDREARRHSYEDDRLNVLVAFPIEENDGNPTGYYNEDGEWTHANVHSEEEFNDVMKDELWANSYPSGHSAGIGAVMQLLQMLFPQYADRILRAANRFANHRSVARYHWLSDTRQGRFLSSCIFPIVCACGDFKQRVQEVINSLKARES